MIFYNQLRFAVDIIDKYRGETPLHTWLKDYFRLHKQMGSRDRKLLSTLVYSYYRLGHAIRDLPVKDRLVTGLYLCNDQPSEFLRYFRPDWPQEVPLTSKIDLLRFDPAAIFPWKNELSAGIDHGSFCLSFLRQPDLFIRIRPGHEQTVRAKLADIGEFVPPSTYRLPNGFKVEAHFTPDREVVIQDYNSQRIGTYLLVSKAPNFFWDACAASGGKSILMHDLFPDIDITVSDIRPSILQNLKARFHTAGIQKYRSFVADLSRQPPPDSAAHADLILADVPCTGSGTWSRTPEELFFFDPNKLTHYSAIQRKILENICSGLQPGSTLVYCTCSVFKKENERMADLLRQQFRLKEQARENLKGYGIGADTLFAARFTR